MADIGSDGVTGASELCTVITTTSPTPSNPSTELIEETLASLAEYAPELADCRNIIVCDGYRIGSAPKYRSGVVTEEGAKLYDDYVDALQRLTARPQNDEQRAAAGRQVEEHEALGGTGVSIRSSSRSSDCGSSRWRRYADVMRLGSRQGFGFAVRAALDLVTTPFVFVVQHDRAFMRRFSCVVDLLAAMQQDQRLKMIGLPTTTNDPSKYVRAAETKLRRMHVQHPPFESLIVAPPQCSSRRIRLLPLLMWHDSSHLASTDYYRSFVFGPRDLVSRGGFIEDKLGQQQGHDLRTIGWSSHAEYGTWLLDDGALPPTRMVGHLNGKRFLDRSERQELEARERAAAAEAAAGGQDSRKFVPKGGRPACRVSAGDADCAGGGGGGGAEAEEALCGLGIEEAMVDEESVGA